MNSISDLIRQSNPYSKYVEQLVLLESQKKFQLEDRQKEFDNQKKAIGDVSSVISKFVSKIEELKNPANKAFSPLATSSSDDSVVRVDSASGINKSASYDITVHRLATKDTRLSQVIAGDETGLADEHDEGSVEVTIGDRTETITVTVTHDDGSAKTNEEILQSFADELNNLFGEKVNATLFHTDSNGSIQLSVRSAETGHAERIQFDADNASGALDEIVNNMTRITPENELDASFEVNGVTFTRGQNTVDDAISGLTFTLLDATGAAEEMVVEKDLEKAKENVESFITAFNELNKTIRDLTYLDGDTGSRGRLQGMRAIRNLTYDLRNAATMPMAGADEGAISSLLEIGIGFDSNGTMKIEDEDLLEEILLERPEEVSDLFTSENSSIASMKSRAESYTNARGVLDTLESGLDQRIDKLSDRIKSEERYLERYEEQQRKLFAELQQIEDQGQAQYNSVISFMSSMGF